MAEWVLEQARYFTEATKAIASVTPGHCLGALEMIQKKFAISSSSSSVKVQSTIWCIAYCGSCVHARVWIYTVQVGEQ